MITAKLNLCQANNALVFEDCIFDRFLHRHCEMPGQVSITDETDCPIIRFQVSSPVQHLILDRDSGVAVKRYHPFMLPGTLYACGVLLAAMVALIAVRRALRAASRKASVPLRESLRGLDVFCLTPLLKPLST